MTKKWISPVPTSCQICEQPITESFIDGRLRGTGSWAIMCPDCHSDHGIGIGTGRGQLYERAGLNWNKTEG